MRKATARDVLEGLVEAGLVVKRTTTMAEGLKLELTPLGSAAAGQCKARTSSEDIDPLENIQIPGLYASGVDMTAEQEDTAARTRAGTPPPE